MVAGQSFGAIIVKVTSWWPEWRSKNERPLARLDYIINQHYCVKISFVGDDVVQIATLAGYIYLYQRQ